MKHVSDKKYFVVKIKKLHEKNLYFLILFAVLFHEYLFLLLYN
jgi:hypothetical protein